MTWGGGDAIHARPICRSEQRPLIANCMPVKRTTLQDPLDLMATSAGSIWDMMIGKGAQSRASCLKNFSESMKCTHWWIMFLHPRLYEPAVQQYRKRYAGKTMPLSSGPFLEVDPADIA